MYNCTPIYLGCKHIDSYIENVIKISGNVQEDLKLIINIIKNPQLYYKKTYNEKNIKAVNLIENVEKLYS
jgi:hypothetical protein